MNGTSNGEQGPRRNADAPSKGVWRPILLWAGFAATLVITVIIVVQAILQTKGFS